MLTYHGVTIDIDEILIYARKSRTDDPLLTIEEVLEKHENILNDWCNRTFGKTIASTRIFREIVSGETIAARPEFQTILRLIEQPKNKAILTVDVQRLSRGDLEDAGRLIKLLRYTNTFVITPEMVFDLNDEYDRERFKRELERGNDYLEYYKKINWRGRVESVKAGWFIGSRPPYGYDRCWVLDGKRERPTLKINEREAEAVRIAFDLYVNKNMGCTNIARRLNDLGYKPQRGVLWSTASIRCLIENDHYIGKVRWCFRKTVNIVEDGEIIQKHPRLNDYLVFEGKHPAIIDEELFERAKAKKGKNARVGARKTMRNPFAGLVYCRCGRAMTYRTYKNPDGTEKGAPRLLCDNQSYCHVPSVAFSEFMEKVKDVLRNCIADFEIQIKRDDKDTLANRANHIKRLEARLDDLHKKEVSQWEKYSEEGMPKAVFDKLNAKVLQEKEIVMRAIDEARKTAPTVDDYQEKVVRFSDALNALDDPNASVDLQSQLLRACIERIEYTREPGTNRYNPTPFELDITLKV